MSGIRPSMVHEARRWLRRAAVERPGLTYAPAFREAGRPFDAVAATTPGTAPAGTRH